MRTLLLPHSPLILAALITAVSFQPLLAKSISVVDPSTGETVELSEVDFEALSEEERADIRDQLKEQGVQPRGRDRNAIDISEVEVVDPSSGETVALGDIDHSSLSPEDRRNIGDQLAEQGIPAGRGGEGRSAESGSETADSGERDGSGKGRGGRGGEGRGGHGGRGGPRG
ncbi:hypothetical protein [Ruegeria arenilitoris]|uniref:hypothetical protein n=1 Tax=Ruegeria arenilitoris TaxID=1173585 RepID=UPI00147FB598|nr:hypothetical protein [Ruegeria arenilitoris]